MKCYVKDLILIVHLLSIVKADYASRNWASSTPSSTRSILLSHRQNNKEATSSMLKSNATQHTLSIPQRLIAGGTSRGIAQMILYPVDALRTLAQTRDGRTLADVGARALVRGCTTTSSFAIFIGSIQFAIFGATREYCGPVIASGLGAAGSCLVSVPQEVIKQRLVTGVYSSFRDAVATIYRTEGVTGFYSAWRPTVARNIPFVICTFTAMDVLKHWRLESKNKGKAKNDRDYMGNDAVLSLTVKENLIIGISSSLIGASLTHPVDVIKTRMMTQAASKAMPYSSTLDCIETILRTEGLKAFYSGFLQRCAYMGPLWAFQFALNGKFSEILRNRDEKKTEVQIT